MNYVSTRDNRLKADSLNAVLNGIAPDGGLYVGSESLFSGFDAKKTVDMDYRTKACSIMSTLLPDFENMEAVVEKAYSGKFDTSEITPLVKVGNDYVLELFHGPTSAFKDVALSMLPLLITQAMAQSKQKEETVILTATSGDTGKAALEGFKDVHGTKIVVFYPYNGVSEIQKTQMVTQQGSNVLVCAVKGNFDDCQREVKKAFVNLNGKLKGTGVRLSSANSINIGRLAPQVVYYFSAYGDLVKRGDIKWGELVDFVVPTGNFGDILAGFYAKQMGLPVGKLVCACNQNNVLEDFINTGVYDRNREFYKTQSPSMDILVSSNLERLLFMASAPDSDKKVSSWMNDLADKGRFSVDDETFSFIRQSFVSYSCSEEETRAAINSCWNESHYLCDPHTAVAWHCLKLHGKNTQNKCVVLSTASAYKFPRAVLSALGYNEDLSDFEQMSKLNKITGVPIPENLKKLENAEVRFTDVVDRQNIESFVLDYLK